MARDDMAEESAGQNGPKEQVEDVVGIDGGVDALVGRGKKDLLELRASRNALIKVGRSAQANTLVVRQKARCSSA
jgi:hypothetical protein